MSGSIHVKEIYTIGHGILDENTFFILLKSHDIKYLIDCRSAPYSKKAPQYNYTRMHNSCRQHGIEYRYLGDLLGGRPTNAELLDSRGEPDELKMRRSPAFVKGITLVKQFAENNNVCILCGEPDPVYCHRYSLIGAELANEDISLQHIYHDGQVIPQEEIGPGQQMDLF